MTALARDLAPIEPFNPRTGPVTYLECTYLLNYLHNRGLSFLLVTIYRFDDPQEWQLLRDLVHCIRTAERGNKVNMHELQDKKTIRCEVEDGAVTLIIEGRKVPTRRTLTPDEARVVAVMLLQGARRAA